MIRLGRSGGACGRPEPAVVSALGKGPAEAGGLPDLSDASIVLGDRTQGGLAQAQCCFVRTPSVVGPCEPTRISSIFGWNTSFASRDTGSSAQRGMSFITRPW
ncbi:hypothetical protein HBB16_01420 [Pseudonocardia sp. MCCB 268]|nr:hypothetical protein [Pseudonocardia cytotoxica]